MKIVLFTLLVLSTRCTLQPKLHTDELIEWSVDKDVVYYLDEPIAKIVVWEKATAIPINSTCDRSKDYKSKEHYELIHGINTLETLIVRLNKSPELNNKLIKFVNTNYKGIRIIK
jgi:hypothetical protein